MNIRPLMLATLVAAFVSPLAHADVATVKEDIKHDTKAAAHKTGEAARGFGHATAHVAREVGHGTANAARTVGHGIAHVSREGYEATKHGVKKVFHKQD